MATWTHTLRLKDIFNNDDLTLEQKRDTIVKRIRAAKFYDEDDWNLVETVDELAEVDDVDYFNYVWDAFYDWADAHRIWVETF